MTVYSTTKLLRLAGVLSAALPFALGALPATAQDDGERVVQPADEVEGSTWVDIATWEHAPLYDGWRAGELLDEEAYGENGDVVGEVEDFIVGPDGFIQQVVVEGGGFLDIGDSHLAVPWSEVTRSGEESITTPLTEANLDGYGMFENVDDMPTTAENFRMRHMLGSYVTADGVGYGDIRDVIISEEGKLQAVIVYPAYGYGYGNRPVAVPYYSDRYDPYGTYYQTPYTAETLSDLRPFDYRQMR